MDLKDQLTKAVDTVKDTVDNVKDATSEALHRVAAQVEQQKRNVAGQGMTTDAKAGSIRSQAKSAAEADVDAMRRAERNKPT